MDRLKHIAWRMARTQCPAVKHRCFTRSINAATRACLDAADSFGSSSFRNRSNMTAMFAKCISRSASATSSRRAANSSTRCSGDVDMIPCGENEKPRRAQIRKTNTLVGAPRRRCLDPQGSSPAASFGWGEASSWRRQPRPRQGGRSRGIGGWGVRDGLSTAKVFEPDRACEQKVASSLIGNANR
jgi:hypothetical protein